MKRNVIASEAWQSWTAVCGKGWPRRFTPRNDGENGHILITALLILMVMNLMAIGVMQVAMRITKSATFKTIDSEVFHITDSCTDDAVTWLKAQTAVPSTIPPFAAADLNFMLSGSETQEMRNRLSGYAYGCTLEFITDQAPDGSQQSNSGEEIGRNTGYGGGSALTRKYYYKAISTGGGPKNAAKVINTIISAEY